MLTQKKLLLLSLMVALSYTGVFIKGFFYDGTAAAKYVAKSVETERVNEDAVFDHFEAVLFNEGEVAEDLEKLEETSSAEEGAIVTEQIFTYEKWVLAAGLLYVWLMVLPWFQNRKYYSTGYLFVGMILAAIAFFKGVNGGAAFSELAIPASANRWLACVALFFWIFLQEGNKLSQNLVTGMLILAAAMTFAVHGYEAFEQHPKFRDLLYGSFERVSIPLNETMVTVLLKSIGIMDIALALIVLVKRNAYIFLWMAIWGGVTALSRPMALGDTLWVEALLRTTNFGVPFMLYLFYKKSKQSST